MTPQWRLARLLGLKTRGLHDLGVRRNLFAHECIKFPGGHGGRFTAERANLLCNIVARQRGDHFAVEAIDYRLRRLDGGERADPEIIKRVRQAFLTERWYVWHQSQAFHGAYGEDMDFSGFRKRQRI